MFDEGETKPTEELKDEATTQPQQDDWLVVGERKYDKEAAVTKITHADNHIANLEKELADMRSQLELTKAQKEAKEAMFNSQDKTQSSPQPIVQPTADSANGSQTPELLSQVEQILLAREQEQKKASNLEASVQAAKSVFGDAYQQKLEEIGSSLGLSKADIKELASSKPQVFRASFGLSAAAPNPKPSAVSTVTIPSQQQGDDPYKNVAKVILNSTSSQERTRSIANLLNSAKR